MKATTATTPYVSLLHAGQQLRIYQKPLTREDYEGIARLIAFEALTDYHDGQPLERWRVRFVGTSHADYEPVVTRSILVTPNLLR